MSPRSCTTLPIRVLSTALLPRRSLSASISSRWRSSNSTLKNCDNWASRIFDIRPSCLEWSSNKLERSYTNFSGLQETIENTLFHDDVNSGNAPLRRLFERRITNTSFNSIQFNSIQFNYLVYSFVVQRYTVPRVLSKLDPQTFTFIRYFISFKKYLEIYREVNYLAYSFVVQRYTVFLPQLISSHSLQLNMRRFLSKVMAFGLF